MVDGHKLQIPPRVKFWNSFGDVGRQKHGSKEGQIPNRIFLSSDGCLESASINLLSIYTKAHFN